MTDDERKWLESLPRVTLTQRMRYYDARDFLQQTRPALVRPYMRSVPVLIVRCLDRDTQEVIAYANCATLEEAQAQVARFDRLFIETCDIEIRRAVMA